jgi:hypothetical protein
MAAVYVLLGLVAVVVLVRFAISSWRGLYGDDPSIDRYHHTMGLLGKMSEHETSADPSHEGALQLSERIQIPPPPPVVSTPASDSAGRGDDLVRQRSWLLERTRQQLRRIDHEVTREPADESTDPERSGREGARRRFSKIALASLVALGLAAGLALILDLPGRPRTSPPANSGAIRETTPSRSKPVTWASSTTSTTTSTLPASGARGGAPSLSALVPTSGVVDQSVTLTGSGFESANGTVVVTFNGQPTPTRCANERQCTATVPTELDVTAVVRVQTESGKSNGLAFRYR